MTLEIENLEGNWLTMVFLENGCMCMLACK